MLPKMTPFSIMVMLITAVRTVTVGGGRQSSTFDPCSANSFHVRSNRTGVWPYRTYMSSNSTPPELVINNTGGALQNGLLFFDQQDSGAVNAIAEFAAFIMTDSGDLVYSMKGAITNFHVQTLSNESVLTLRTGSGAAAADAEVGYGYGQVLILNSGYEKLYTVCPDISITLPPQFSNVTCFADVHESQMTEDNTMLITVYNRTQVDLSSIGGPVDGWVVDPLAVEVDPTTNKTLFIWSPLQHVPITDSHLPLAGMGFNISTPYDYFHTNAIQKYKGSYLVNSRHTWTTYLVNKNGTIEWQINGENGGDLGTLPENAHFSWQHDARISTDPTNPNRSILRYFANNNHLLNTTTPSIGLAVSFDYPPRPNASNPLLHHHLTDPDAPLAVYAEGANNPLPNGNSFMGYGIVPYMREYAPNGTVLWSAQFGFDKNINSAQSYRAFKQEWHGRPARTLPSLVVADLGAEGEDDDVLGWCAGGSMKRGYVSWNGATDVTGWNVYVGGDGANVSEMAFSVRKGGFETQFVVPMGAEFVQVGAVEGDVEVRRSDVVAVGD